ncbi:MAG: universal stress protein, partial [Lentisphaerae bacterium]|nr:universal stress protein [Lentisphaerota bacterium]
MYTNILIATDLSRDSDELVRCVTSLQALGCRRAHLVYGLEIDDIGPARAGLEQLVQAEIEKQKTTLEQAGIETSGHLAMHPVNQEVERIAKENNCSLVVVGSRLHSLAGEIIAGGIAATILSSTRHPLLMLRLHQTDTATPAACNCWPCSPLQHVLLPTDFSPNADRVFTYIEHFIKDCPPERITLMHVQDQQRITPHLIHRLDEFNATDRARLEALHQRLAAAAPQSRMAIELPFGAPSK